VDSSGDNNGRITLAVIGAKLENIERLLHELKADVKTDHDRLGKIESDLEDFILLKRILFSYGLGLIVTMALALYAVLQHNIP
jgi:hypothetical protein